jgi:signal transduction histidine kinase
MSRAAEPRPVVSPSHRIDPVAAEVRAFPINIAISLARYVAFAITFWSLYHMLATVAPPARVHGWGMLAAVYMAVFFMTSITHTIRNPDAAEIMRVWRRVGQALMIGAVICIVVLVWLLMPYAPADMRMIVVIFAMGYIAVSVVSTAEHGAVNRFSIVAVLGSVIAFYFVYDDPWRAMVIAFVGLFAGLMFFLSEDLPRSVRAAVSAQLLAETAQAQAEAERETRLRFLASASHDLGQPLQSARLFLDQVLRSTDPVRQGKAARDASMALEATDRILQQLLDHLRLDARSVKPHLGSVATGAVIARLASQFEPVAALADVALIALSSRQRIHADGDLVERALGNLIDNGLRHAGAKRLLIGARRHGSRVRLWVIDDGTGVAEADLPQLFDDYVQGSDHGDAVRGGFGLGLATVKRLAALMGGTAGIDRRWTAGSAFYLEFSGADGQALRQP